MTDRLKSTAIQWLGDIALTAQFLEPSNHDLLLRNISFLADNLERTDVRIANWEAPLMGDEGVNPRKKLAIHTDEYTARHASGLNLNVALTANNHILDCLESGLRKTVSFLDSLGIRTAGCGLSEPEAAAPAIIEAQGAQIVVLAYVDQSTNPNVMPGHEKYLNWMEPDRVLSEVAQWHARGALVLVHFHCGMDFVPLPSPDHRRLARKAIEAGASVVVCYHPHRILGYERRLDGYIFYSLGNLIAGSIYPWPRFTQPTAVVTCRFRGRRVDNLGIRYFILRNGQLEHDTRGRGARMHRALNPRLSLPDAAYERVWARALLYEMAVTRPLHFLRRNPNPLRIIRALEKRHVAEYWNLAKNLLRKRNEPPRHKG